VFGCLASRDFKLKELDKPRPIFVRDIEPVDPPSGKVVKGVAATFAAIPFAGNPVDLIAPTSIAKNMATFPAMLSEIETCSIFGPNYVFKAFYEHLAHCTLLISCAKSFIITYYFKHKSLKSVFLKIVNSK